MFNIKAENALLVRVGEYCRLCCFVFLILTSCSSVIFANSVPQSGDIHDSDRPLNSQLKFALDNSTLPLIHEVTKLYESREYNLIWSDGTQYNLKAHDLYKAILNARKLGLNPADYNLEIIKYFLDTTIDDATILNKSDITFTHAYVKLASHMGSKTSSYNLSKEYDLFENNSFLSEIQNNEIKAHVSQNNAESPLLKQDHYSRLLNALEKYRNLSDDFEPIILQKKISHYSRHIL